MERIEKGKNKKALRIAVERFNGEAVIRDLIVKSKVDGGLLVHAAIEKAS